MVDKKEVLRVIGDVRWRDSAVMTVVSKTSCSDGLCSEMKEVEVDDRVGKGWR